MPTTPVSLTTMVPVPVVTVTFPRPALEARMPISRLPETVIAWAAPVVTSTLPVPRAPLLFTAEMPRLSLPVTVNTSLEPVATVTLGTASTSAAAPLWAKTAAEPAVPAVPTV